MKLEAHSLYNDMQYAMQECLFKAADRSLLIMSSVHLEMNSLCFVAGKPVLMECTNQHQNDKITEDDCVYCFSECFKEKHFAQVMSDFSKHNCENRFIHMQTSNVRYVLSLQTSRVLGTDV